MAARLGYVRRIGGEYGAGNLLRARGAAVEALLSDESGEDVVLADLLREATLLDACRAYSPNLRAFLADEVVVGELLDLVLKPPRTYFFFFFLFGCFCLYIALHAHR